MPTPHRPDNAPPQELVLLIHGTFANNPKSRDAAPYWWEENGDVWHTLDKQFPDELRLAADRKTEVFCWTGDNSERDRRAGGHALFKHLQSLEHKGIAYHLIGHSHGGSVIWHCLQESVRTRLKRRRHEPDDKLALPSLRSWTTVGTPFLQLRSFGFGSRITPFLWLMFLLVAVTCLVSVFPSSFIEPSNVRSVSTTTTAAPPTEGNSQSGNNTQLPAKTRELLEAAMKHSVASKILVVLVVLMTSGSLVMWAWASAVKLESAVVREESRIRNQAYVDFGARWLGIWSRHDEAINGLRASLRLAGQIAPRITVSAGTVFDFDRRMRAYRWLARWIIAPLFNQVVSRPTDGIIWRSVSRGMQGNDRPGCLVSDVTPGPIAPRKVKWEELPEFCDTRLVERSNAHLIERSRTLLPQLREVLSQLAWTRPEQLSLLMSNETTFQGNELVHTSYFADEFIVELITCHIRRHNHAGVPQGDRESETARWCQQFRHKARDLTKDPSLHRAALPLLGQSNRRAFLALLVAAAVAIGPFFIPAQFVISKDSLNWLVFCTSLVTLSGTTIVCRRTKRGARGVRAARWANRIAWCTAVFYAIIAATITMTFAMSMF